MKFKDADAQEGWERRKALNTDSYGAEIYRYAQAWAELMECHLQDGKPLAEIWKKSSHVADTEGITGNMYGIAVMELARAWEHGEELRKLHNASWGNPNTDGVVNPAVITVGGASTGIIGTRKDFTKLKKEG